MNAITVTVSNCVQSWSVVNAVVHERIGAPTKMIVTIYANPVLFSQCLGAPVSIKLHYRGEAQAFGGLMTLCQSVQSDPGLFVLTIESPLVQLCATQARRTFVDESIQSIITEVLASTVHLSVNWQLKSHPARVHYVVQYNETDYDFFHRVLAMVGISYSVRACEVLLFDDPIAYSVGPPWVSSICWRPCNRLIPDRVQLIHQSRTSMIVGKTRFNLRKNTYQPDCIAPSQQQYRLKQIAQQALAHSHGVFCVSDRLAYQVGVIIPRQDGYVVYEAYHHICQRRGEVQYEHQLWCQPKQWMQQIPDVTQPQQSTYLRARVVACESSALGRVHVRYPWDQRQVTSPPVSVRHYWCGKQQGAVFMPQVGEWVWIAYEHGMLHCPIVMGSEHAASAGLDIAHGAHRLRFLHTQTIFSIQGRFSCLAATAIQLSSDGHFYLQASGRTPSQWRAPRVELRAGKAIELRVGGSQLKMTNTTIELNAHAIDFTTE